jgi:hypothetical protein
MQQFAAYSESQKATESYLRGVEAVLHPVRHVAVRVLHPPPPVRDFFFCFEVAIAHGVRSNKPALDLDVIERDRAHHVFDGVALQRATDSGFQAVH